jgi:hypothetical protein
MLALAAPAFGGLPHTGATCVVRMLIVFINTNNLTPGILIRFYAAGHDLRPYHYASPARSWQNAGIPPPF